MGKASDLSGEEVRELIDAGTRRMGEEGGAETKMLLRALTRGIGIHHAGLSRSYKEMVEILFRCRYLKIVIATGEFTRTLETQVLSWFVIKAKALSEPTS